MSAAMSGRACPSECSDDVAERASKRACIEVRPYTAVSLDKFALKNNGKGKGGHNAYPLINGGPIRFNFTPSDWVFAPFGFDISGKYEYPSFLGGKEPERDGASEGLNLRLNLESEHSEFLSKLDALAQNAFAEMTEATWTPMVVHSDARYSCKVKVVLKGDDLTKLTIVQNGIISRGEGWDFLQPFLKKNSNCRFAEVKLHARVKKLWNVAKKAGLSLEATQIVLRLDKPMEELAYMDNAELLAQTVSPLNTVES